MNDVTASFKSQISTQDKNAFKSPELLDHTREELELFSSLYAADVWATGVTLYAMLFGVLPFWGVDCDDQFKKILATRTMDRVECPSDRSAEFVELLNWMLAPDPSSRKSCEECESAPWIQQYSDPSSETFMKTVSTSVIKIPSRKAVSNATSNISNDSSKSDVHVTEDLLQIGAHSCEVLKLSKPVWCGICETFICCLSSTALKCTVCGDVYHDKCFQQNSPQSCTRVLLATPQKSSAIGFSTPIISSRHGEAIAVDGHMWYPKFCTKPTSCGYCKQFIWGVTEALQDALKCSECKVTGHKMCCLSHEGLCTGGF